MDKHKKTWTKLKKDGQTWKKMEKTGKHQAL